MNQPSATPAAAPATTPATAPAESKDFVQKLPTFEDRARAVFGDDSASTETAGESGQSPPQSPEQPPGSPAVSVDAEQRATERRARIDALKAQERASVDAQQRHREQDSLRQRLEVAEKRASEAERIASQRFDIDNLDETRFFDLARRAKVTPQRLAEHIQERMADPEAAASQAATRALDPALKTMQQKLDAQQQVIDRFLQTQQQQHVEAQEAQAVHQFIAHTQQNAADAPYAAGFLREFGAEEFATLAKSAAASVPPQAGWQAVLDVIEDNLSGMAKIYAANPAAQQRTQAPTKPNPAAAKAPTVSNSLAQERASVVDENQWGTLSYDERAKRVFG